MQCLNSTLVRCIVELYAWLDYIMTDSICYCSATMKVALRMLLENKMDCLVAPIYRLLLPVTLTGFTTKKKWKCGCTFLPSSMKALTNEMEAEVLHSLIKELNSKLGLKLDPSLNRELEAKGSTGPPQILVVGASNAARTADALERQKAMTMADLVKQVLRTAKPNCVVVFQIFDSSFHFARTEDGGLMPACRAGPSEKFHVHGEAVVACKESQFSAFTVTNEVMAAAAKHQLIIISPLKQYLYNKCCPDKKHCSNFSDSDYRDTIETVILACRRNPKDFAFWHSLRGCKILCPWSTLRGHAELLWKDDLVHMTTEGFDLLAGLVPEAATGADNVDNKKRPLNKPDDRPGLSKKRLF